MSGEKNRKGGLRPAAGPGEWRRFAVMRGSAALPVVVPARTPRPERGQRLACSAAAGRGPAGHREPGHRRSASAPRPLLLLLSRPGTSCGRYHGGQRRRPAPSRRPQPLTGTTHHRYLPFRVSSSAMGALTGPEPAQGGPGQSAQPGAANDRAWPARLPGPVPAGEGRGELKLAAPGQDRGSTRSGAARGRQPAGHFPR
jgi:hypothetical protein